jgi:transposase
MFMARPRTIDAKLVARARAVVAQPCSQDQMRAAQSVLLPAVFGATLEQTAEMLGVGRATVHRLQRRFRHESTAGAPPRRKWGGRRHALMSLEEEEAFLAPWLEQARTGGMVVVSPLRAALAQHLGRPVAASVVYRLLARRGWRKVAPDTRHPKNDPVAQEEWKKNSPKCWRQY